MVTMLMAMLLLIPGDLAALVPSDAKTAVLLPDPAALGASLAAFTANGHQRTLATYVQRLKEHSRRDFALDVLDERELGQVSISTKEGIAIVYMEGSDAAVLVVPKAADDKMISGLHALVSGRYTLAKSTEGVVDGVTVHAVTVGDAVTPRLYWASAHNRTFLSGPRGKQALVKAVTGCKTSPPDKALGPRGQHELVWLQRSSRDKTAHWHTTSLDVSDRRLTLETEVAGLPTQEAVCVMDVYGPGANVAYSLAQELGPGALAFGYGASTRLLSPIPNQGATVLGSALSARAMDRLQRLQAAAPAIQEALREVDVPFAAALYTSDEPGARRAPLRLRDALDVALVAQADTPKQKARLEALAKRLMHLAKNDPQGKTRIIRKTVVATAGQKGFAAHVDGPMGAFEAAWVADMLIISRGLTVQRKVLSALSSWRYKEARSKPPKRPPGAATFRLTEGSRLAESLILAGAQGPLGAHPAAAAVPQLLLLGPTGDLLHEMANLGELNLEFTCAGGAAQLAAHVELAK